MSEEVWRPLGYDGDEAASYDALHDGVPDWMRESFWLWMRGQFSVRDGSGFTRFNSPTLLDVERACRTRAGYTGNDLDRGMKEVRSVLTAKSLELRVAARWTDCVVLVGARGRSRSA